MAADVTSVNNRSLSWTAERRREDIVWEIDDVIRDVASPIIIFAGLVGNAAGTASLLRVAGLRRRGMGHLLVAICVSNAVFLASVLPTWVGGRYGRRYDLYERDGWCELLSLTTMSSNFLSTWFTVTLGGD